MTALDPTPPPAALLTSRRTSGDRIFDRLYRGTGSDMAPGTGLGLYVARKILVAHGGSICLEDDGSASHVTTFRVTLPILRMEALLARKAS